MEKFLSFFTDILIEALGQTIYMVGISTILATLIGFILAIVLVVTDDGGLKPNKIINSILGFIVNIVICKIKLIKKRNSCYREKVID